MQNNPKSFKKFKKAPLVFSTLFLAMVVLGFWFVSGEINQNKKSAEVMWTEWQKENLRRHQIRDLEVLLSEAEAKRAELDTHFAESSNIVPFLDTTQELARKVGAESEIISVDNSAESGGLTVVVHATGSFESLYKFLELLEHSPYELEFLTVDLGRLAEGSGWEANFKLRLLTFIP
ncbi:MAG: hypothetical protein WCT29_02560 [Candidatus Paceibacterota bacterium]|jgi:hypothetical protein